MVAPLELNAQTFPSTLSLEQVQFLQILWEGINYGIFRLEVIEEGTEFRYTAFNPTMIRISPFPIEPLLGKTVTEALPAQMAATHRQHYTKCVQTNQVISFEEEFEHEGQKTWWLLTVTPCRSCEGNIEHLLVTAIDITAQKVVEKELREREQTYRQILDAIGDYVLIKGPQSRILFANKAFRDYYGMSETELRNLIDAPFNQPDYTQQYIKDDAFVFESGQILEIPEEPVTRHDGVVQLWNTIKSPVFNMAGEVFMTVGVSRDITERKAAEVALTDYAEQQRLLNQLANQIRNSLDLDTVLDTTIQAIRNLLEIDQCCFAGYSPNADPPTWDVIKQAQRDEIANSLGCFAASLVGPIDQLFLNQDILQINDVEAYNEPVHRAFLQTLNVRSEVLLPIKTHSQRIGVIICGNYLQHRPWSDREVNLLRSVSDQLAIAIDQAELYAQTHRKSQELETTLQELQRTQAQVVQSEKMSSLGQLVAGIAHEINNPINFIHGNLTHAEEYIQNLLELIELYQQEYPHPNSVILDKVEEIELEFISEDLPKLLTSMNVGTERIREIVKSLRLFSRLDEADVKLVDIHEGINSTLMILHNRLKAKADRPEIEVIKNYGDLPLIECYAGQLNQVFMNILVNSIDAIDEVNANRTYQEMTHSASQITICTSLVDSQWVQISIADNGAGVSESIKKQIFDPFFTTKPVGKGTGMGMSISYQIITEKHQGKLECFSTIGEGTQFVIQIPIQQ